MKLSFAFICLPIFLLFVPTEFVSCARTVPFSGSQLANEVAKAFLNSLTTWNTTIFGVGKNEGEDRYKINPDSLDRMKNKFRVPMPAGQGLEKLLRAQRVEPIRENIGMNGTSQRVLAPHKLMELVEKLGNVLVTDPTLRGKIDKYNKRKADEAARKTAAMPKKEDPQTTAKRRTWPKVAGTPNDAAASPTRGISPTRLHSERKVWMENDDDGIQRWRQRLTFSSKREKSWFESDSDSDDASPTSVLRPRRRSRVNILDDDEPPRRGRSPTPHGRSPSPNGRSNIRRTSTTTSLIRDDGRRTVKFGEVTVLSSSEEGGGRRRTEMRTETETGVVERKTEYALIVKLDFMDASDFLSKVTAYFAGLNEARKNEGGVRRFCFALKGFDSRHDKLNAFLGIPSVATAFTDFKKAMNDVGLNNQSELRLVEKSNSCAFDLAMIFALAQFTKDLLTKLKAERMIPAEELDDSKTELTNRLVKLFAKILDGLKPKASERSTEVDRRLEALPEIEDQLSVLKQRRLTDESVTGAMAKVTAQLKNMARGADTPDQRSLKSLQMYWGSLLKKDTHWQIRQAMGNLEKCATDVEGSTDNLKKCMTAVVGTLGKYIDEVDSWFKEQKPIDMDDWNWAADIQFLIQWKNL